MNENKVNILLYGAGWNGRQFLSALRLSDYAGRAIRVVGFIDKDPSLRGQRIMDVEVFSPTNIPLLEFDKIMITARTRHEIVRTLIDDLRVPKGKIDSHTAIKSFKAFDEFVKRRIPQSHLEIPLLVVVVGQQCTLRCKDCANFSPFSPDECKSYPISNILDDLRTITAYSSVLRLQIQGGEPFIYPHLDEILRFVIGQDRIKECRVATNATVIPKATSDLLQSKKISVRVSNYPSLKNKADRLLEFLKDNSINHRIHHFVSSVDAWNDMGPIDRSRDQDDLAVQKRFDLCAKNRCFTLEGSKIGYCSRGVIAEKIQGFKAKNSDYLKVDDSPEFGERLKEYVNFPRFMEACRYCNGTAESRLIEPAVQLSVSRQER